MAYIGIPPFGQTVRTVTTITATGSQTTFTPNGGYTVGYVDVYYNGIKLVAGVDFTASNGTTVVLTVGATANAVIEIVAYGSVSLADSVRRSGDTFAGTVNFPNNNIIAANGNVGIGNTIPGAPLVIGSASGSFTNPLVQAAGNANSWIQINAQNLNNGNNASTDLVLARSDGTDTSGFIDIGVNSNTYAQAAYSIMSPRSGYVFTNGGDLSLGTQTNNNIIFHTGNTTAASERMRIDNNGVTLFGTGTRFAYSGAAGDVVFNNGASDTPGIQFQYGANTNFGIDSWNDGTNQFLRIVNDINQAGGSMNINISRNGVINLGGRNVNSGTGIAFPVAQNASTDPNTLDDYEEGTWSPWSAGETTTYGTSVPAGARYTKIGNVCFISFRFTYTSTAASQIYFALPFVAANFGDAGNSPTFLKASWQSGGPSTVGFAYSGQNGSASATIYSENTNYAGVNWNSITSKNVTITGHYYTA